MAENATAAEMATMLHGIESGAAMELRAEDAVVEALKSATVALRDAGLAVRAAQERYQAALQAFNRFVAPEVKP